MAVILKNTKEGITAATNEPKEKTLKIEKFSRLSFAVEFRKKFL